MVERSIPTRGFHDRNAHIHTPAGGFVGNYVPNGNINVRKLGTAVINFD